MQRSTLQCSAVSTMQCPPPLRDTKCNVWCGWTGPSVAAMLMAEGCSRFQVASARPMFARLVDSLPREGHACLYAAIAVASDATACATVDNTTSLPAMRRNVYTTELLSKRAAAVGCGRAAGLAASARRSICSAAQRSAAQRTISVQSPT